MSPFGFGPENPSDDDKERDNSSDFAAMMEQVQRQLREQFQQMGFAPSGFVNPLSTDPLPQNAVREHARKVVSGIGSKPIGNLDTDATSRAFELADLWLNEATVFPVTPAGHAASACSRQDWVDNSLAGWRLTFEPLASGLSSALARLLEEATASDQVQTPIPMQALAGILRSFIGTMIATQLGQSIGTLATSVTSAHDVALPLLDPVRPVLIPENITAWGADLEVRSSEVFLFHALREGAIARLFAHNPWLVSYIRSAIVEYGKNIHIDLEAIQRQAQEALESAMNSGEFDPTQPQELTINLNNGIFSPEETPQQREALAKLETVLALVDGWAEEVIQRAAMDRLPSMPQLIETLRRKRASASPAQQLFASLLGLHVSPRLAREATSFFAAIRESEGVEARDKVWSGILPEPDELSDPIAFVQKSAIPDDLSGL